MMLTVFLLCFLLNGCTLNRPSKSLDQGNQRKESTNYSTQEEANNLPYQGSLTDVNGLLMQLNKDNPNLHQESQRLLRIALDAKNNDDWGAAAKGFGESIVFMPTNEALLGYAMSQIMTNVYTPDSKESLNAKIRNFQEAIKVYKATVEFGQRSGKALSNDQEKLIKSNVSCLEAFLKSPNTKIAPCDLVSMALKASKIY